MFKEYKHKEAFALMYYESDDKKKGFVVWNSRDGVTPFIVFEDGVEYHHAHFGMDARVTNQHYISTAILLPGQRIFRTATIDEVKQGAEARLLSFVGTPYELDKDSEDWKSTFNSLVESLGCGPVMRTVTEAGILP